MDVQEGRYTRATLQYPGHVGVEAARASLNRKYADHEYESGQPFSEVALWHHRERGLWISLFSDGDTVQVIFSSALYLEGGPRRVAGAKGRSQEREEE